MATWSLQEKSSGSGAGTGAKPVGLLLALTYPAAGGGAAITWTASTKPSPSIAATWDDPVATWDDPIITWDQEGGAGVWTNVTKS